jgi:hypothetical protein
LGRDYREAATAAAKELVRDQRLGCVNAGAWFPQYTAKGRTPNSFRFYKVRRMTASYTWRVGSSLTLMHAQLSANKKVLHYTEDTEKRPVDTMDVNRLPQRSKQAFDCPAARPAALSAAPLLTWARARAAVDMAQVGDIKTGEASPLLVAMEKNRKKGDEIVQPQLTFSLISLDGETSLADFVCDNEAEMAEWVDGYVDANERRKKCWHPIRSHGTRGLSVGSMRVAMDKQMAHPATQHLITTLSGIDVKIRTTEIRLHRVPIAPERPKVPPPPSDYVYKLASETM